jgi:hypothetical protein
VNRKVQVMNIEKELDEKMKTQIASQLMRLPADMEIIFFTSAGRLSPDEMSIVEDAMRETSGDIIIRIQRRKVVNIIPPLRVRVED